jgi:hypothetical protein
MLFEPSHDRSGRVPVLSKWRLMQDNLEGIVSGDPDHSDRTLIETSSIPSVEGNHLRTRNSEYELGDPDPAYVRLLESMRPTPEAALHFVTVHNSLRVRTAKGR